MKYSVLGFVIMLAAMPIATARFSERRLESAMAYATKSGKFVAFVFYKDYALPNCPKCISRTNAANKALKSAIPRGDVVVIEIEPKDTKYLDKLPSIIGKKGRPPSIVVTDAKCEKVIAKLNGAPDRDKAKAFEATIEKARAAE